MAKVERSPGPGHDGYNGSGDHGLVPPLWALNHLLSPDTQGAERGQVQEVTKRRNMQGAAGCATGLGALAVTCRGEDSTKVDMLPPQTPTR